VRHWPVEEGRQGGLLNLSVEMLGYWLSSIGCLQSWVFSLVIKNYTQYRASLSTDRKGDHGCKGDMVCHMESFRDTLLREAKLASYKTVARSKKLKVGYKRTTVSRIQRHHH